MKTVRLQRHLDSDTLHLPELRELIGKDVRIVVDEIENGSAAGPSSSHAGKNLDQVIAEQDIKPVERMDDLRRDPMEPELFDGFESALRQWRREGSGKRNEP